MGGGKYAELCSVWNNVGEEVQWLAQERFLPRVDFHVGKFRISDFHPSSPTKLIINGHYPERVSKMVTAANVKPLLVSIYIAPEAYREAAKRCVVDFLRAHGPVGCRDLATLKFLHSIDVPAYFSGCLTLTLQRNPSVIKNDYVICVGLTDEEVDVVKKHTTHKVMSLERTVPMIYGRQERMDIARAFLALYQGAHCVVTRRLHVALPCLAFETPVVLVQLSGVPHPDRFDGYYDFFHHADLLKGFNGYDLDCPPRNPRTYVSYRDGLIEKCTHFTGFCNHESLISITDPFAYFMKIFSHEERFLADNWREAYKIRRVKLFDVLWKRTLFKRRLCDAYPW